MKSKISIVVIVVLMIAAGVEAGILINLDSDRGQLQEALSESQEEVETLTNDLST